MIAVRPSSSASRPTSTWASDLRIEVRRRFVEDQDAWFGEERAGQSDQLPFAR